MKKVVNIATLLTSVVTLVVAFITLDTANVTRKAAEITEKEFELISRPHVYVIDVEYLDHRKSKQRNLLCTIQTTGNTPALINQEETKARIINKDGIAKDFPLDFSRDMLYAGDVCTVAALDALPYNDTIKDEYEIEIKVVYKGFGLTKKHTCIRKFLYREGKIIHLFDDGEMYT